MRTHSGSTHTHTDSHKHTHSCWVRDQHLLFIGSGSKFSFCFIIEGAWNGELENRRTGELSNWGTYSTRWRERGEVGKGTGTHTGCVTYWIWYHAYWLSAWVRNSSCELCRAGLEKAGDESEPEAEGRLAGWQATRQPETQQVSRFNVAWVLCGKFDKSQPAAAAAAAAVATDALASLAIKTAIIAKSSAIERHAQPVSMWVN